MLTVIGCGNTNRSDDAAGVLVAQRLIAALNENPVEGVRVFDAGTSGMDTMFQARGSDALIIVDANISDSEPGSIFEVPGSELDNAYDAAYSLHDFRWDHALHAGKKIFGDEYPEDVTVYLIEVKSTELGLEQSEPVLEAVGKVVDMIWSRINAPLAGPNDAGSARSSSGAHSVVIHRGNIYVDAEIYQRYFSGIESVAVLANEGDIALMPVRNQGGGGLLLKIRNARGDRVIHAREILESAGISEDQEINVTPKWDSDFAALRVSWSNDSRSD